MKGPRRVAISSDRRITLARRQCAVAALATMAKTKMPVLILSFVSSFIRSSRDAGVHRFILTKTLSAAPEKT